MVTRREVVARKCYETCQKVLPSIVLRWHMFLYGIIYNLTYRDLEEEFLVSEVLRKALNLKDVPHYSTICKAVKRLLSCWG